jgi:3-(3-hydroxy-phenyl)propionate hydroxylase
MRLFTVLQNARPVFLNLGTPGRFEVAPWSDRIKLVDAQYDGPWELPALGSVSAPTAVLIRPDGYVAWVGDRTQDGLRDAMNRWFGPPSGKTEN